MSVTIREIRKRIRNNTYCRRHESYNTLYLENAALSIENKVPKDIMRSIEIVSRESYPIQFESVLSLFDALYECGTVGQMRKMCNYICEEAVPKVRDGKETLTNIHRKLGRIKSKVTTKANNNIQDAKDAVKKTVNSVKSNFKANTEEIKSNVKSGLGMKPKTKTESYIEFYEQIAKTLETYIECDRIIRNYNDFSKRYNLEKVIVENTRINGVDDTVRQIASFADTYDMPNKVKFMLTIESAWLGFEQNNIEYSKKDILQTAMDYYMMYHEGAEDCQYVLKNTTIYDPEDIPKGMEIITEIDPTEKEPNVFDIYKDIQDQLQDNQDIQTEGYDFNKIFSDFKKTDDEHKESKLMMLVRKLYTKNVSNIVNETPNFLNWIRLVFVLGTVALNPVLGAVVAIGDIFARLHFERSETEKMIKCFDNEIKKSQTKLKSVKDEEEKKRLKEYINALNKAKEKIENYYEKMLTDKEIDKRLDSDSDDSDSFDDIKATVTDIDKDDDFDFDFDDDDDDSFLEYATDLINNISDLSNDIIDNKDIGMKTITNLEIFNGEDLDSLAKLSAQYPEVWGPELLESAINSRVAYIKRGKVVFENALERFQMLNSYDTAIKTLHSYIPFQPTTFGECVAYMEVLRESIDAINSIIYTNKNRNVMVEASFTNTLRLASEKLKKNIQKLSDKDKTISRNVDVSLSQLRKSMENSLTNENREAVIKGSILPSSSKIIKLAITTGALWLVNPAVSVITALGYLALSAKHKRKERQLILDELEIELKMCEKYIDIAESKNDMKSLKQLLTIQKNLKRQEQRIRYRMKVDFNQNVPRTDAD